MQTWPIGVFTSVDAGLGVRLDVAHPGSVEQHHIALAEPTVAGCESDARLSEARRPSTM